MIVKCAKIVILPSSFLFVIFLYQFYPITLYMCLVRNRTGVFYFVGPYVCALLEIEQACTNLKDPIYVPC